MALHLETARLIVRPFTEEDIAALIIYRSHPEVARYQLWDAPYTNAAAQAFWERQRQVVPNTPNSWQQLALEHKASGQLIGDCALHTVDLHQVELGYTLAPAYQGRGYMSEALTRVISYLFTDLGKHRLSAEMDARNTASARLAERLGFRREAHFIEDMWFKGEWSSTFVYALLAQEWQEPRAPEAESNGA